MTALQAPASAAFHPGPMGERADPNVPEQPAHAHRPAQARSAADRCCRALHSSAVR